MKIDLEHIHHWMCAIRKSNDPMRTLDAFWRGQILSKQWLIDQLCIHSSDKISIEIHGGWVGTLASMLFQTTSLNVQHITSVDIDPACQPIAEEMNRIEYNQKMFVAETLDMCYRYPKTNVVINTCCEHITQEQYDIWLSHMSDRQLIVLQSNNYMIPEHVRIANNLDEFEVQSKLTNILYMGELELPLYKRFMIMGHK